MNPLYIILFVVLLATYAFVIPRKSLDYWWVGINKLNYLYYPFLVSLLLVFLSFFYILYYTSFKENCMYKKYNIYWSVLLVASIVWTLFGYFGKLKLSIIPLAIVGIMGLMMFWEVPKDFDLLTLSTFWVAFHTFLMDFVIWGYFSLKN